MKYDLNQNINKITPEFIDQRIPATDKDRQLLDSYRSALAAGEERWPVFDGTLGAEDDYPVLTHFGFATLSIDDRFMSEVFIPKCKKLEQSLSPGEEPQGDSHRLILDSLLEFALLGCLEAQQLMFRMKNKYRQDDAWMEETVLHRWPNLQRLSRFLMAQSGAGHYEDSLPTYRTALSEVRSGCKRQHWIWYVFPQMYGIPGTHSGNSLYFGLRGRMEAMQYICHPVLRERLIEISNAVIQTGKRVSEIFPQVDAQKVCSCMHLFYSVSGIQVFNEVLRRV